MNRPSRGERLSAATTRYDGCLVLPTRIKRSFTAMVSSSLLVQTGEPGRHLGRAHLATLALLHLLRAQATHPLHQLLHLLELLHEAIDIPGGSAAAIGDAQATAAVDELRPATLLERHRADDGFHRLEL